MIQAFQFVTVPHIEFGWGHALKLTNFIAHHYTLHRVLIVTTHDLIKNDILHPILDHLHRQNYEVSIFDQIESDPSEATVIQCTEIAHNKKIELVIGIGGGSVIDVAKMVAVLAPTQQKIDTMYGIDKVLKPRLPLILLPTTAGTGSEVTNVAILTIHDTKKGIIAKQLYADSVITDPQLMIGLPRIHTAASGIDAMVHAIESYTSLHLKNPISDTLAKEALRLLTSNLIAACEDGKNRSARENMALGALLAGQAFSNSPVAAVHALAYPLGGRYHIAHGISNALMLCAVLKFNASKAMPLYIELSLAIGQKKAANDHEQCGLFINYLKELIQQSGVPKSLQDAGVRKEDLGLLAKDAMMQNRLLKNNPVEITQADALSLYQEAYYR